MDDFVKTIIITIILSAMAGILVGNIIVEIIRHDNTEHEYKIESNNQMGGITAGDVVQ